MGSHCMVIRHLSIQHEVYLLPIHLYVPSGLVSFNSDTQYPISVPYSGIGDVSWIDTNTEKLDFIDMGDAGSTWICGCEFKISYTVDKVMNGVKIILTPHVTKTISCNECVIPELPIYISSK